MEALGAVIFLVIIFAAGSVRKSAKRSIKRRVRSTVKRTYTPVGLSSQQRRAQPPRYDARSATRTTQKLEVKGPAYVVDGDTIVIQKTQIRLFGIDAPEIDHPYGKKAKWTLVSFCKGQTIRAHITAQDRYGRTVAKCYLPDGRDLSEEMVKLGMAIDWPKFSGGIYRSHETADARKKLWLADARQKGRMHVWEKFEVRQKAGGSRN